MTERKQLDVLGGIGTSREHHELEEAAESEVGEGPQLASGSPHRRGT